MNSFRKRLPIVVLISLGVVSCTTRINTQVPLWMMHENPTAFEIEIDCADTCQTLHVAVREMTNIQCAKVIEATVSPDGGLQRDAYSLKWSDNHEKLFIESSTTTGILYATYAIKRMERLGETINNMTSSPAYQLRMLNHWDNLDGSVERGYAGSSLWKWDELPRIISPRYAVYATACANIGINATVLNNVNASPEILTHEYLQKIKVLADIFRVYGIKVFLSVNFASPMKLGGCEDADPLRPEVQKWWNEKANEIYELIPDFGGFLAKANSEGQPGPLDYGRSHADGANMLAKALQPHGGIVMWRAFVYSPSDADRAKQAYIEFEPYDGKFADNVIIQIKNGPVDFQPREPFSPLFGALDSTQMMAELQITQEYTGHANHLCYLAPMWTECLNADTFRDGEGSTIAELTSRRQPITAIAGVSNIGDSVVWCANPMAQINWYAFGRLAWDPTLSSRKIAEEWTGLSFPELPSAQRDTMVNMLCESHETVVDYMMPLGLHHLFAWGHHYGPEPWCAIEGARPDWLPSYYHRADEKGLGFDRSPSGSAGCYQYNEPLGSIYADIKSCPDELLLWFHHASWNHKMHSGRTLWEELCFRYSRGMRNAQHQLSIWEEMRPYINNQEMWLDVYHRLSIQANDAQWWHDACLLYFQEFSKMPIPEGTTFSLEEMKRFRLNINNYQSAPHGFLK